MITAIRLSLGRHAAIAGSSAVVAAATGIPIGLVAAFVLFGLEPVGMASADLIFFVTWIGSMLLSGFFAFRRGLRRARGDLAAARVIARECIGCGSGVRGVVGPADGIVRCPECGEATLRKPGVAIEAGDAVASSLPAGISVLGEPGTTLLALTDAESEDVDHLTVALAERHPGLGTPAFLAAFVVFVLCVIGAFTITTIVDAVMYPAIATTDTMRMVVVVPVFISTAAFSGWLAWRVFRSRVAPAWRRVAITAIEGPTCFACSYALGPDPGPGAAGEPGWRICPECGFRSPVARVAVDADG